MSVDWTPLVCPRCGSDEHLIEQVERRVRWARTPDGGRLDVTPTEDSDPLNEHLRCTNPESFGQPCWAGSRFDLIIDTEGRA